MKEITYAQAIHEALQEEMFRDGKVFLMGEDVGLYGGISRVTKGLLEEFGAERVRDTPISESAIVGVGVGAAVTGMRPVVEIMFSDLLALAMDQIVNQAAKIRYMFGGKATVPMVIRTSMGGGRSVAAQHSQNLEAWFLHIPGLKVVIPSTPYDAKGLLKTAIRDDNPVLFFENRLLYPVKGPVPEDEYTIQFKEADVKRKGEDVTIVAILRYVNESLAVAGQLEKEGISVEVVDPRTLVPLDKETIVDSVKKTGRLIIVEEGCKRGGVGAEIAAIVVEEAFDYLDAPISRVAASDVPIPFAPKLEKYVLPDKKKIFEAVKQIVK